MLNTLKILIHSNLDFINQEAKNIGFFRNLKEQSEDEKIKQYCDYFTTVSKFEIEALQNDNQERRNILSRLEELPE